LLPGGQFRFDSPTEPGYGYTIQSCHNFADPANWTTIVSNIATTTLLSFTNTPPRRRTGRFLSGLAQLMGQCASIARAQSSCHRGAVRPEKMDTYVAAKLSPYFDPKEFKPEVGFEFQFTFEHEGFIYAHHCKILEVIPGK
jgi:hypothetical protein